MQILFSLFQPFDHDGPEPIIQMNGDDSYKFILDGNYIRLADGFNADTDSLLQITVRYSI